MTARNMMAVVAKAKYDLEVSDDDIMKVTGWTRKVFRSRWNNPDLIRLGE